VSLLQPFTEVSMLVTFHCCYVAHIVPSCILFLSRYTIYFKCRYYSRSLSRILFLSKHRLQAFQTLTEGRPRRADNYIRNPFLKPEEPTSLDWTSHLNLHPASIRFGWSFYRLRNAPEAGIVDCMKLLSQTIEAARLSWRCVASYSFITEQVSKTAKLGD
jgi:hypothetical protein